MAFDPQPTLTGTLLQLRPLRPDDFEVLYAAASDPLIWEQHPESTRYARPVFQKYFDGALASGGAFVVIDRASSSRQLGDAMSQCGRPLPGSVAQPQPDQREGGPSTRWLCHIIGSTRYYGYQPGPPSQIEIGYTFLQRAYWGGRYNGEMKRLLVAHALQSLDRVVFRAGENNQRSRHALLKIGARLVGPADRPAQDGSVNLLYEITRSTAGS